MSKPVRPNMPPPMSFTRPFDIVRAAEHGEMGEAMITNPALADLRFLAGA
jgi:hypothetical protein